MKTKYVHVNTCCRCGNKAGHFIWSTSAGVNPGISSMFKGKICLPCYKALSQVYPKVSANYPKKLCPSCKGKIVSSVTGIGDCSSDEYYCEDCGLVVRNG